MYKRTMWQDHVEGIQEGTDLNAANFNNLEAGTMEANALAAFNTAYQRYAADVAKNSEPVVVEAEITGIAYGDYSAQHLIDIPDSATRNNVNYNVVCEVYYKDSPNDASGCTIIIDQKQVNGFRATLSAKDSETVLRVRFIITGGMI